MKFLEKSKDSIKLHAHQPKEKKLSSKASYLIAFHVQKLLKFIKKKKLMEEDIVCSHQKGVPNIFY